ncbi:50S ribosomal protein L3 [Achromatium sp. WMS3]|nr:50S ribosomal protein L3 [Achromatium sp. WMS3]
MAIGVIGRKTGMTRIFTPDGTSVPVTVIEVESNRVVQLRTLERDGYRAVQITTGERKPSRISKPLAGHFANAGVESGRRCVEFRLASGEGEHLEVGNEIGVDIFKPGQKVDVQGRTKGRGFSGAIKRHHFRSQRQTHGNSLSHRSAGSIGQNQTPGRVMKGKRMAGHLGNALRTQQNLEIVKIDLERQLLLVKGAVPGHTEGDLLVTPGIKQQNKR